MGAIFAMRAVSRYVSDRRPIPINYNPQLTFTDDPVPAKNQQASLTPRAALAAQSPSTACCSPDTARLPTIHPDVASFFMAAATDIFMAAATDICRH